MLPLGKDSITLKVSDGMAEDEDEVTVDVVDTVPPVITGAPTVPANAEGWYNSDVTVHFVANDSCPGININKTAPVITIASPFKSQYKTNEIIKLDFSAIDELSGVKSCTAMFDGKPAVNGQIINLAQLTGTHSFSVTSVDIAGNTGTRTVDFTVSPIEDGRIKYIQHPTIQLLSQIPCIRNSRL